MNKKILLIEDDPSIGEMMEDYIIKEGFDVDHAVDVEQAIQLFQRYSYDIILDLMLPKLNGMELLETLEVNRLINRFFDLTKLESGDHNINQLN